MKERERKQIGQRETRDFRREMNIILEGVKKKGREADGGDKKKRR